jgi:hypothetical protein
LKRIRSSTVLIALTSLGLARSASGQDVAAAGAVLVKPDAAVGVAYDAPPGCPEASVFMERLRTRTAHADLAPVAEGARFSVIVSSTDSISSARIEFNDPDGMPATRTVSGRTCDEVVSAAALITALTIEASSGAPSPADPKEPTTANPLSRDTPLPLAPREPPPRWLRSWGFGATGGIDSWTPGAGFSWGGFGELAASARGDQLHIGRHAERVVHLADGAHHRMPSFVTDSRASVSDPLFSRRHGTRHRSR